MSVKSIVQIATDLQTNSTKLEIVSMARSMGWRGDYARAPMLQLALYVATKIAASDDTDNGGQDNGARSGAEAGADNEVETPTEPTEGSDAPTEGSDAPTEPTEGSDAPTEPTEGSDAPTEPTEGSDAPTEPTEGSDAPTEPQDDEHEFAHLLKQSGIVNPHRLLEKVWRLTTKANQNVLLIGPAGSGKTMLSAQLAQLIKCGFSSISCSGGMSESQLTGWLLPKTEGTGFGYVASPFVNSIQSESVFLLDELDAADNNVLMVLNSVLANGFINIPHKTDGAIVQRHKKSIVLAGANTGALGNDIIYGARNELDGATLDRFYPVIVDYDQSYIHNLFSVDGGKTKRKAPKWKPSIEFIDQFTMDNLREYFIMIQEKTKDSQLTKIVGTRYAQKLIAAVLARIPVNEVKQDLLTGWSVDDLARIGVK